MAESVAAVRAFEQEMQQAKASNSSQGDFIFLNKTRYDLSDSITILGCTLWSDLTACSPEIQQLLGQHFPDFAQIRDFTFNDSVQLHRDQRSWLNEQVSSIAANEPHRRIIIMTHHAPVPLLTSREEFRSGPNARWSPGFCKRSFGVIRSALKA